MPRQIMERRVVWEDRGALSPVQVFWGEAGRDENPASRLPTPPFTLTWDWTYDPEGTSPKCRVQGCKNNVRKVDGEVRRGSAFRRGRAASRLGAGL